MKLIAEPHTSPAKLEGVLAVVVVPHLLEPALRPTVGDDEEKAQKLSMHPPGGGHDAGQAGMGVTSPGGVALTILTNLGASSGLCRAQRSVAGDISHVIAPELVVERDVNDEVEVLPRLTFLSTKSPCPIFPLGFVTDGMLLLSILDYVTECPHHSRGGPFEVVEVVDVRKQASRPRRRRRPSVGGEGGGWGYRGRHGRPRRPPQAPAAPCTPGRAPGGPPGRKTAQNQHFPKVASGAHCECWFWVVFGGPDATPWFVGSMGLGSVPLAHFCRHRAPGKK